MGRALEDAADDAAELVIVRLDTPGGLDTSMREIVKDIIAAPMPVVVYVSPNGARAASAGLFITQAADVAAMAPQTNIGSASPITIGGEDIGEVLGTKIENDAAAYVRALTEEHGRNPDLAEEMVRDATNVTAAEALEAGLIDIVAADTDDLLEQLDGFEVQGPKATTLDTEGLTVDERDMPLPVRAPADHRQPERRLPSDPGGDHRAPGRDLQPGAHRAGRDRAHRAHRRAVRAHPSFR